VSIIEELVGSYGYVAVAGIIGGESMGLPLPGESVLIAAGAYAGATHHLSVALVFLTAAVAAVVGDNVGFWVGRRFGPRLLAHAARRGGARQQHLQAVLRLYARHGGSVVVVGRYVSVVRTYAAFGAGAAGMGAGRFAALNAAGGTVWAAVFGFGSAALGARSGPRSRTPWPAWPWSRLPAPGLRCHGGAGDPARGPSCPAPGLLARPTWPSP